MNRNQNSFLNGLALALALSCAAPVSVAQPPVEEPIDRSAVHLQPGEQNGISYLEGGIGLDESRALQQTRGYNLQITLSSGPDNKYQSGAELRIESAGGQPVLTLQDIGPMLYAKVPAGHYQVVASINGQQLRQQVLIDGTAPVKVNLHWPE
ncbi:carboxypeptidase regulatory-like domain-containing protein [Pseudomonas putida]|uniref:carboxypeptidase regulatory-like domain-containing protein n=1 Tax=Pseudomonas putida TaxID=303 RepID=UPI0023666A9D|nr:carboxypeptidase regulatory-like domain-containing protein [Pseudomonas putida]MDD2046681.1 carboxypeptidase regulatory-like domain-containing protein [Pseudomonas putida]